ncbi:flagellar hook-length control protein FliK [Shewanella sp. UCD-KL12]|uniref:flagellar hook-length control protein FliK n=1 Tax=Shewanella sp. UCD-KL12 TaxID=1917163 RepID=UPI0009711FAD|nr:flagellar hook-length control protein FliK [Shewanella sp. UCD-KL12]
MQKMTNVLLASKDNAPEKMSTGGIKQSDKSESKSAKGDDFSAVLEQANAKSSENKHTQNTNSKEGMPAAKQGVDTKINDLVSKDEIAADKTADVNHLLAQINLASDLDNKELLQVSGDTLPLDSDTDSLSAEILDLEALDLETKTLAADELLLSTDSKSSAIGKLDESAMLDPQTGEVMDSELLNTLIQQTGLTEDELTQLAPEALTELIAMAKGVNVQLTQAQLSGVSVSGATEATSSVTTANASKVNESIAQHNPQASLAAGQVSKGATIQLDDGKVIHQDASKGQIPGQQLDLSLQGRAGQATNILGEKSIIEEAPKAQVNTKLAMAASIQAEQQLKGADLSVKLSAVSSLEGTSQNDSSLTSDLKVVQTTPLGANTHAKPEIPQFQLSLRQHNEQQNTMQDMIQRFSPVMKQQLVTMVSQGIQHAEIRLDPPELGQVRVRIQVQGDQTQVQFQVAQHQTRDIVEQALPRLKDMLAEQGMQLTDSHVSQQDSGKDQGEGGSSEHSQDSYDAELDELSADDSLLSSNQATSYRSGIDYYA